MMAILKREFLAYFRTPLGFVLISVMYFFTGYYFFTYNIFMNTTDTAGLFATLFSVVLFIVPVLTMKLLSEERRMKTDQILLTAPVTRFSIVLGKYFAALCVYLLAISGTILMALVLEYFSFPDWPVVFGNFFGMLLLGSALIAICLFISSLTENQVVAAVGGFAASLFLILLDAMQHVVTSNVVKVLFRYISWNGRYRGFTIGIIGFSDVVFFISITAFFLCLTVIVLEYRRWK
jgi:ABC-2 type transport system permease protein